MEISKEEQEAIDEFVKRFEQRLSDDGVIEIIVPTGSIQE